MEIKYKITITPEEILEAKEKAAQSVITKLRGEIAETFTDRTGDLRSSISYLVKNGSVYIMQGTNIIAII